MVGVGKNLRRHFLYAKEIDQRNRPSNAGKAKAALSSHLQEKWPAPIWTCASPGGCTEGEDANWIRGLTEMVTTPIQTPHGAPTPSKLVDAEPRPHVLEPTNQQSVSSTLELAPALNSIGIHTNRVKIPD